MPRAGLTPAVVTREAAQLADEVGYESVSMAALAGRLGVAVPSLYKHVGGLEDVQRRVAIQAVQQLGEALAHAVDGVAPGEGLPALAAAYRNYARAHPGRYSATVRAPDPDATEHRAATDAVLATVLDVLAGYGLAGDTAVDAARAVRSALHGFIALEAAGGFGLPRDVERSYAWLVDLLHAGAGLDLGNRPASRPRGSEVDR